MRNLKRILAIVVFTVVLTACGKNNDGPPPSEGIMTDTEKMQEVVKNFPASDTPGKDKDALFKENPSIKIKIDGNPIRGNLNAPVTVIEFSDFQCPVCERFYREVGKKIKETYVNTGKVKLVHMDYPLYDIHDYALSAAKAGECSYKQGKFWEMHDFLFENQYDWQNPDVKNILTNAAGELGINKEVFSICYDSDETLEKIGLDYYTGKSLEVRGTPTFFINGKVVVGFRTFEEISELLDAELKK